MKMSIFSCFGYSFVKYLCFANCSIGLSHSIFMYLKMDTWFTSLTSYRPIPCIFFQGYSVYVNIYIPQIFFFTQIQFYTMDLIYLKGHCTPQHSLCMYNTLYLIYWWHTGRCSFLLLQTSYCKHWSANIFVYMGESACRINSWAGLLGHRVRTLRFLWFTFAILLCKELNKLTMASIWAALATEDSPNFHLCQPTRWKMRSLGTLNLHSFLLLWMRLRIFPRGWTEAPL